MVRFSMHSIYGDASPFPDRKGNDFELYCDTKVEDCKGPGRNIAMLIEPRSLIGNAYDYVAAHPDYFKAIFTHDDRLLNLTNAHLFLWCDVWCESDSEKTKGISLVSSWKNWCPLHNARLELYQQFLDNPKVDCFYGDWNNSDIPSIKPEDYLEHYKFSIVIENDIDDFWYTEKILNCFATKTVPIYVGAGQIKELFNPEGIIQVKNYIAIPKLIEDLNLEKTYNIRLDAIEDNFKRVEPYKTPWKERFFRDYGDLLEEMLNE